MLEFAFEDEEQDFGKMTGFNEGERNGFNLSNEHKLILTFGLHSDRGALRFRASAT
jgi:hypothetical protein